jgi:hypothetical protein
MNPQGKAMYFLTTDNNDVRGVATNVFQDSVVFNTFFPEHVGSITSGLQNALVDFFVLAACDVVVISSGSTFSGCAAALSGEHPYEVHTFSKYCFRTDLEKGAGQRDFGTPPYYSW